MIKFPNIFYPELNGYEMFVEQELNCLESSTGPLAVLETPTFTNTSLIDGIVDYT